MTEKEYNERQTAIMRLHEEGRTSLRSLFASMEGSKEHDRLFEIVGQITFRALEALMAEYQLSKLLL